MKTRASSISIAEVFSDCEEAVRNAIILEPDAPAVQLGERLADEADPERLALLSRYLVVGYYTKLGLAEHRKQARTQRAQLALPGFEHLPIRLRLPKHRVSLHSATYSQVREYYWSLRRKYREQGSNNPKLKESKALLDKMRKRSQKDRGITVAQVLGLDAMRGNS